MARQYTPEQVRLAARNTLESERRRRHDCPGCATYLEATYDPDRWPTLHFFHGKTRIAACPKCGADLDPELTAFVRARHGVPDERPRHVGVVLGEAFRQLRGAS